jgi:hypothetical protein
MSMSFYAQQRDGAWAFPADALDPYIWPEDPDAEPSPNPAYRPELDINLSNANAQAVLAALGYEVADGCFSAPAQEFAARAAAWLQSHLDRPSAEVEARVDAAPGRATFIDCGLPAGYFNATIRRLSVFAHAAVAAGAVRVYAA